MNPRLFAPGTTDFSTRGIGTLAGCKSCYVTEERNGIYELEIEVPITNKYFSLIEYRAYILAKPNPYDRPQPFYVYSTSKPIDGVATFKARHVSYDTDGLPVRPFIADSAKTAMQKLNTQTVVPSPFTFSTDILTEATMLVTKPYTIRDLMAGQAGSVIDTYGGEYQYDFWSISLLASRGKNRGVKFAYGKNILDLRQEANIASVYTGVLPYWYTESVGLVQGEIQYAPGTFPTVRIFPLDLTEKFENAPTVAQLNAAGASYVRANKIGVPSVSLSLEVVPPGSTGIAALEDVRLCDTVSVRFERLGIDAQAKVIATKYDVLRERYSRIELGDRRETVASAIVQQSKAIAERPTVSTTSALINALTASILGAKGGAVRLLDTDGDGVPDTLYIADSPDPETAVNVWRFNYLGWGASTNGYNGPFVLGADFADGGTLYANNLRVTNINGESILDKTLGNAPLKDSAITERTIESSAVTEAKIGSQAVTNSKIGGGAVSYGKTSFTGTLDQVGVNKSNIEAINTLFAGTLITNNFVIQGSFRFNGSQIGISGGHLVVVG